MSPKRFPVAVEIPPRPESRAGRLIDTASNASRLRARTIDTERRRILIARLEGSAQAKDLSVPPNGGGFGRIRHFRRTTAPGWPLNPLPIDPACRSLGLPRTDLLRVQAFQNEACAWRCWYCFVPFNMLAGDPKKGAWLSAEDLVEFYANSPERPVAIDLTGGSPDLTPEWPLWMMQALRARGLEGEVYLWSDDNLSTDYYWRFLTPEDRAEIVRYRNYGRVACFKGFDEQSFSFNTQAEPAAFKRQFELMGRLLDEGIDCYAYATFTGPDGTVVAEAMPRFVDRMQMLHPNLPLRTVPLRIEAFSPVAPRMNEARRGSLEVQERAIEAWNKEISQRFSAAERAQDISEVACGRERPDDIR